MSLLDVSEQDRVYTDKNTLDRIKVWKNGSWQRAVVYDYKNSSWRVSEVWSTDLGMYNKDNLNATRIDKVYIPNWWARYNKNSEWSWEHNFDLISANGTGGGWRVGASSGKTYDTYFGMPYQQIMNDYQNTFGIARVLYTYTLDNFGVLGAHAEVYGHQGTSCPTLGSTTKPSSDNRFVGDTYFYTGETYGFETSGGLVNIISAIGRGEYKGILFSESVDFTNREFTGRDFKIEVMWAGK
mgnify:CR=1 FL=1